jgi:hypothetical protein
VRPALLPTGVVGSILLTAGGYCYVRLPHDTWMDRASVVWSVRSSPHHLAWGLGLGTAGLVLLTWAWWALRREVRGDPNGLSLVRRAAAAWSVPLLCAPPLFSGDGWSYVATGVLTGRGLSPYLWTPSALPMPLRSGVSPVWRFTPSPYGPLPLALGGSFSWLSHDPWFLLTCYRLTAILGLALLAWAVPVLARSVGRDPVDASALVVASPFVLAHGVGGLHNDLIVAGLAATALAVTRPGKWLPGALLVGLAASVKAPGALAAVGVVLLSVQAGAGWWERVRRSSVVGGVTVAVVLASGWMTGLGTGWIGALAVPDREHTPLSVTAVAGHFVRGYLDHAGSWGIGLAHAIHPELLAKKVGVVLLVITAAVVLLAGRRIDRPRALGGAAAVLSAGVLFSPVVHYWYFLWCVPVLACLPLRRPAASALVAGITTLGLVAPADRALGIRWQWEGAAWALVIVPLLAWLVVAARERRDRGQWASTATVGSRSV